jgi:hypothetical protein
MDIGSQSKNVPTFHARLRRELISLDILRRSQNAGIQVADFPISLMRTGSRDVSDRKQGNIYLVDLISAKMYYVKYNYMRTCVLS